ncbi:MAG TPA: Gfo/Idh/MocA family oxidoreductase [Jatrophihabitans sp.]|nr:Gfo/Idh/MocA family oxidoreductase [Jatrophihabitans sp.]
MSLGIAVIGAGYWGPNLVRNFRDSSEWDLVAVCDLDEARARKVIGRRSSVDVETSLERLLARDDVAAVAVATPARTHSGITMAALAAGKHVLVEKPIADSRSAARRMIAAAHERDLVLMADHTYCYTPVVTKIAELLSDGVLGELLFIDSVRINLGLIQPDVDVFWDLAPHDLSILDFVLPDGLRPEGVAAHGADPMSTGRACVGYLTMPLPGGAIVHLHVNWLSPTKIRQMVIGGTRRTLVWDDLNPQQRLCVYDRGVEFAAGSRNVDERAAASVSYRLGEMSAPALPEREALATMAQEFAEAITRRRPPRTDGHSGLRVLDVLDATSRSLSARGALVTVDAGSDVAKHVAGRVA